jgi:hypothetical protein
MGILIWQDAMFACSMYPANEEDTDRVEREIRHQGRGGWKKSTIACRNLEIGGLDSAVEYVERSAERFVNAKWRKGRLRIKTLFKPLFTVWKIVPCSREI